MLPASARIFEPMLAHPPAAIVAAGGTGELYSLTPAEHLEVVRTIVEECSGRVPVIAGVGFNAALGAALAAGAAGRRSRGHSRVSRYYPNADDQGVLVTTTGASRPPLHWAFSSTAATGFIQVRHWSRSWPTIPTLIGWKDGQGDIRRLQILMDAVGDRLHWIGGAGDDLVPAYYAAGVRALHVECVECRTAAVAGAA